MVQPVGARFQHTSSGDRRKMLGRYVCLTHNHTVGRTFLSANERCRNKH